MGQSPALPLLCLLIFLVLSPYSLNGQTSDSLNPVALPDFPGEARDDAVTTFYRGKIWGGFGLGTSFQFLSDWWVYDTLSQEWSRLADPPISPRQYVRSFRYRQRLFLYGGIGAEGAQGDLWTFHLETGSWEELPRPPLPPRWAGLAVRMGQYAFIGLGRNQQQYLNDLWRLNLETMEWQPCPPFPGSGRANMVGLALGEKILVAGGNAQVGSQQSYFADLWFYDPRLNRWEAGPSLPQAMAYVYHTSLGNNALFWGGFKRENQEDLFLAAMLELDRSGRSSEEKPLSGPWRRGGNLLYDGHKRVYLIWGLDRNYQRLKQFAFWKVAKEEAEAELLFPNPASQGRVWFRSAKGGELRIYNLQGLLVEQVAYPANEKLLLNLSPLAAGPYFLQLGQATPRLLLVQP